MVCRFRRMKKILIVIGTRPEAIKLAPVAACLRGCPEDFTVRICTSAQHRQLLDQALRCFNLTPDLSLDVMRERQTPNSVTAAVMRKLEKVIAGERPDLVLVQGDTATALAAALAAALNDVHVAHVEAGLRSYDRSRPWPEELNRVLISHLALSHFAPTAANAENLRREKVHGEIHVTGNTVLDALLAVSARLDQDPAPAAELLRQAGYPLSRRDFILVTGHRRESFGAGLRNICDGLLEIARTRRTLDIVYAVHLNPRVRGTVRKKLSGQPNIHLLPPLEYEAFVLAMKSCRLILTDSGGIQEEAPSLDKPVILMREVTERPEAEAVGAVILAGATGRRIAHETFELLDDPASYAAAAAAPNPYGDGRSAPRIADILAGREPAPPPVSATGKT